MKQLNKKGNIGGLATKIIGVFIGIVVVLLLAANLIGEVVNAGNNVSATGAPLSSLFSGTGLVVLLVMVGLFIGIVKLAMSLGGSGK